MGRLDEAVAGITLGIRTTERLAATFSIRVGRVLKRPTRQRRPTEPAWDRSALPRC